MATDLLTAETISTLDSTAQVSGNAISGNAVAENAFGASMASGDVAANVSGRAGQGGPENSERAACESARSISSVVSDLLQLTKPRIVVMILVTTMATAMLGAGGFVATVSLLWLLAGTAAVAASAGAANQIWERRIDCRMTRTANRPLPAGRLSTLSAVLFTTMLGVAGTAVIHLQFGPVPAAVGVATWLLYVLAYTPMKTRTAWNTTMGAIAGAIPVLIGYTATGGTLTDWTGWLLVGVLVAWQYPHFMSIAWLYRRQYAEAGFQMTTTVEPTGRSAGRQSVAGSLILIGLGVALCVLPGGWLGAAIASVAVTLSALPMLLASIRFAVCPGDRQARKLLRSSLLVLPAVLAIVTLRLFW